MNRIPTHYLSAAGLAAVRFRAKLLRDYLQSQRTQRVRDELAEVLSLAPAAEPAPEGKPRTGWPPGLLQDDSRELSQWLASQPDGMQRAREATQTLALARIADKASPRRFSGQAITGFGDL